MFYRFFRNFCRVVLFLINGSAQYLDTEKLPQNENYILVAPHRTFWDPIYLAIGARPKEFSFMAKEELFKNPILRFILVHCHAFPVNRKNPGPSVIKTPIKYLKNTDLSLIMFPSGTRHSEDLKGGVALIAKMAKVKIVPSTYQGPVTVGGMFKRKKIKVRYGDPIDISDIAKMDKEGIKEVERRMNEAFLQLDTLTDPNFKYVPVKKKK